MSASQALGPGTQIGGYVIQEVLGTGGMGLVYRAYHHRLQRSAAIKVLLYFNGTAENLERFEREAQTVAKLRHPNILTIFDYGEFAGQPFMVTEYMPNGSLENASADGPLPPGSVVELLRPVAAALDYAHSQGVIHRDVKPGNIFLDSQEKPVLADFGLSKIYSQNSLTTSLMVQGTPAYIAPEQARGKPPTGSTDLYSLTVVAYELLTGRLPFEGDQVMDTLYSQVNDEPPQPSDFNPDLSPGIDAVLLRGLEKDPTRRWASCSEMVEKLDAAVKGTFRPRLLTWPRALAAAVAILVVALAGYGIFQYGVPLFRSGVAAPPTITLPSDPAASPSNAPNRSIEVVGSQPLVIGGTVNVQGQGMDTQHPVSVGILQEEKIRPIAPNDATVDPDGTFSIVGHVAPDLKPGRAVLVACSVTGSGPPPGDLHGCSQQQVTLARG